MNEVCDKLIEGGLFVSDGTDGANYRSKHHIYRELWKQTKDSFEDRMGRRFSRVGYAGESNSGYLTIIWQVQKNLAQPDALAPSDTRL